MEEEFNYEEYRLTKEQLEHSRKGKYYCLQCSQEAQYMRYGFTWCEEHKENIREDPEDLEEIVIDRFSP